MSPIEHPYPPGTLVKLHSVFMVVLGYHQAMGHRRAESCYWEPGWASTDVGYMVGKGRESDGLVVGMVLKSQDASKLARIPDSYQGEVRHTIYLVLVGDYPPVWFTWNDVELLTELDDNDHGA